MTAMQGKSFNYLTLDVSMSQVNLYMMLFLRSIIALALGNGESFIPMEVQKDSRLKLLFIVILMFTYLCNCVIFVLKYSY